ncbi:hypothetical protein ACN47E_001018 [Coniothyrium glycines]
MADNGQIDFKLYRYEPSMVAAVIFIILFVIVTALHTYQMMRTRTWIFIPFVVGGVFQVIGYIGRAIASNEAPNYSVGVYCIQTILLLVSPALFAASVYMMLGRIILVTDGEAHAILRKRWLTKLFVTGDVISFLMQGAGGGIMASGTISAVNTGEKIIIGGLIVQLLFFGFFVITGVIFHLRMHCVSTSTIFTQSIPWQRQLMSLYGASMLILVRCIFRLIEYAQGNDGYLISHEVFLYLFDAVLMFVTMLLMAWIHPSEITALLAHGKRVAVRNGFHTYQLA